MPILLAMTLILAWSLAYAADVTLQWNPSPTPTVTGYELHYGQAQGTYTTMLDAGMSTGTAISGLTPGETYYFAALAYTEDAISPYSNEVQYTVPLTTPDTTPPIISITNPRDKARVLHGSGVDFKVIATDNRGVSDVKFFINGEPRMTDTTVPYAYFWRVPSPRNRTYELKATARDAAGNSRTATIRVTSR